MGVREDKNELRQKYKEIRANVSADEKKALDKKVFENFVGSLSFHHCQYLIIYVSRDDEVDTLQIIEKALANKKRIAVPKCVPNCLGLEFYEIHSLDDLERGHYGILEPKESVCKKVDPFSFQLCIVPALCFDSEGYRIGFGKGYYDRFLENFNGVKVGLSYSFLVLKRLPRGRFDQQIEIIISEKGVKRVEKGRT